MKDTQYAVIYLRYGNGKGKRIEVPKVSSRQFIYSQIKKLINAEHPQLQFELYVKGKIFEQQNSQQFDTFRLQENSIFHVKKVLEKNSEKEKIILKLKIKNQLFKESYSTDTMVKQLKNDIANDCNMNPQFIYLSHLGQKMDDLSTFRQIGITDDTWLSAEYFADKSKRNQEFDLKNAKLSESVQMRSQNQQIRNSARKSQVGQYYLQIGMPFNNLFSSAISQSIEMECEDQVYDSTKRIQKWVGECFVNVQDSEGRKEFTINCRSQFTLKKIIQIIAKIQKVQSAKILVKNPESNQPILHEERTVANFPCQGSITHGVLRMRVLYQVN